MQECDELFALGCGEGGEELVLHVGDVDVVEAVDLLLACVGNADNVAPFVVGVNTLRSISPRFSSSVTAAVTSLRSIQVLRPSLAWLCGPPSSSRRQQVVVVAA